MVFGEELALPDSVLEGAIEEEAEEDATDEGAIDLTDSEDADPPDEPADSSTDEADSEEDPDEAAEEEEDEPEPEPQDTTDNDGPKPGTPDKYVQQLQQRQASTDKKLDSVMETMQEMMTVLKDGKTPSTDSKPDPENQEDSTDRASTDGQPDDFDTALAELNTLIEEQQADEFGEPSSADLARIAAAQAKVMKALHDKPAEKVDDTDLQEVRKFMEQESQRRQTEEQRQQAEEAWVEFETSNGFDGKPIWQQALKDAHDLIPDDDHARNVLAEKYFTQRVHKKTSGEEDTTPKTVPQGKAKTVKPASSRPRKSTKGTQTAPTGAKGANQDESGERELRCWRPD